MRSEPIQAAPGAGTLRSFSGRYYLAILSGKPATAQSLRTSFEGEFSIYDSGRTPLDLYIANTVRNSPRLKRIIAWDRLESGAAVEASDFLQERLGSDWRRLSEQRWTARDHWTWRDLFIVRRRVYERE
jgi:hypothetical protein